MNEMTDTLIRRTLHLLVIALVSFGLAACAGGIGLGASDDEMGGGDGNGVNYTPYDIYSAAVYDGTGIVLLGGIGSVRAWVHGHGQPENNNYGGGGMCCTSYPTHWVKDRKFVVKWIRYGNPWWEKKIGWRTAYVATVTMPHYADYSGAGVYVQFLPGDKVRLFVLDAAAQRERHAREPDWNYLAQPPEDDPYIYQGVVDPKQTAWLQAQDEATEKGAAREAARQAAIPPEEKRRRQEEAERQVRLGRMTEAAFEPVRVCVQKKYAEGKNDEEASRLCHDEIKQCKDTLSQPEFEPGYARRQCGPGGD